MSRNEYDDLLGQAPKNEYDGIVGNPEAPLRSSMIEAQKTTPERHAEVLKLSNKTLLPPELIERNFDQIKQKAGVEANDYDRLLKETPHLADWLTDPNNAKVAHDDTDALGNLERMFQFGTNAARSLAAGFPSANAKLWQMLQFPADLIGAKSVSNTFAGYAKGQEETAQRWRPDLEKYGFAGKSSLQGFEGLGQMLLLLPPSLLTGQPELAAGIFGGMGFGEAYDEAKKKGLSLLNATTYATAQGAIMGALTELPVSVLSKEFAANSGLLRTLMADLKSAVPAMQVQTLLTNLDRWTQITPEKTVGQFLKEQPEAMASTLFSTLVGVAGQSVATRGLARITKPLLQDVGKAVQESKTGQRLPEALQDFLNHASKDGPVEHVYIPADEARQYFQDKKIDPAGVLGPDGAEQLQQSTGEDVKMPMREYATRIAATEHAAFFNDIARLDPESMNAREEAQFAEQQKAEKSGGVAPTPSQLEQSAGKVREDVLGQLHGVIMPDVAGASARVAERVFRRIGELAGMDPFELYKSYPLTITRPLPEVLRSIPNFDTQLDPLIDRLRAGDVPTPQDIFGTSLLDFIREKGGVQDEGGDLASREIDKERKPFQKRVINDKGLPIDKAREAAAEAGYIDKQTSIPDFLAAIDKEARGEPVYAQGQEKPEALEQRVLLDQLDNYLKSRDIDVQKASNAEIKKALQEASDQGKARDIDARTGQVLGEESTLNLDKRGDIVFPSGTGPGRRFSIRLLEGADASTFVHELGHYWFEVLADVADELRTRPGELTPSQQKMVADYDGLLKYLGVERRDQVKEEHHETLARSFEAYLREGKAPSPELRGIFRRFSDWLSGIYRSLTDLRVNLTPEVRAIFDRLLATDDEIAKATDDAKILAMIEDQGQAERLGLSKEEFNAYADTVRSARDQAKESLFDEYMDEYRERQSDWYAARQNEMRQQVAREVHGQRDYMALSFLKDGTLPDGSALPEGVKPVKLDAGALKDRYGEHKDSSIIQRLRKLDLYRNEGGADPDAVAAEFGYSSGDEMVQAILKKPPMDEFIEAETQDRMRQTYGDMLTDGTAAEKARDAVMTEGRSKVIEAEMKALAKKIRETEPFRKLGAKQSEQRTAQLRSAGMADIRRFVPSVALARDIAESRIADLKVRDVKPGAYYAAAKREGNLALEAVNRGDFPEALKHKQQELVSVEMYRAATDTGKQVEKIRDYMRSFDKADKRGRIGKAGSDYLEQIDKLRERFEFSRQTNKALDQRQSLKAFMDAELAKGHELDIPPEIQNEARRENYRDMTVGELRGLHDAVKSIEHWAHFKNKLLRNQAKRELDQLGADGVASLDGNSRGPRKTSLEMRLPGGEKGRKLESFFLSHLPLGSILREMDGFKDGGFLFENVMRPIDEAGNAEAVRLEGATKAVMDLYGNAYKGEETSLWEKAFVPEINDSLTKWGRLMVALNWGNEGNRQRVQSGFGWNEGQVKAILDTLDERDWKFVQGVWDHINSYAPEIAAKQKRVTGVSPDMVDATPVPTKFGEFKGGYFPIVYENRLTARAAGNEGASFAKLIEQASYTKATTARGHTEARLKNVSMPLRLDPGVITEHLQQVIHDLTHHEMLIDVGRLLGRKDIQDGIYRNYGDVAWKEIQSHIRDIALGSTPSPDWYRAYAAIRSNAVTARLGWNAVTALIHIPNITSGMVRVGPKWVMKGVIDSLSSAKGAEHSAQWVAEQSDMMRLRWKHRMVELSEFRDQIGLNRGKLSSEIHDAVAKLGIDPEAASHFKDSYLYAIHRILQFAEIPTWVGAYEKAVASGREPLDARALADRAILDSIGGGQMKDVASVQKGAIGKIFTTFMTYQLSMHRLGREVLLKDEGALRKTVDASLLVLLPMTFVTAIHHFARPPKKDETFGKELGNEALDHAVGMFAGVRELAGAFQKPDYSGPASFGIVGSLRQAMYRVGKGEVKPATLKAINEAAGELFGYPASQVDKTIAGTLALWEGKTKNPSAVLFGPPSNK